MEVIKALFIPGEEVLWHKVTGKDSSNERSFAITNRRIYKKHYKISINDFKGAPEHCLSVIGDILIIERIGIKVIRTAHKLSLFLETEHEDQMYRLYIFDKLSKQEAAYIKRVLLDVDEIITEPQPQKQEVQQKSLASIKDGGLSDGVEEEKKKRQLLERKIKYLNDKVKNLNENIDFQKSVVQETSKELQQGQMKEGDLHGHLQVLQDINIEQEQDLAKKETQIEMLKKKAEAANASVIEDIEKKNKEIEVLKQNVAKLINLHSASKASEEPAQPDRGQDAEELAKIEEEKAKLAKERAHLEKMKTVLEAEAKARQEAENIANQEAEERAKLEEERKKLAEERARFEEERARMEAEGKQKLDAVEKARREAEEMARKEAEEKAKLEEM